MNFQATKTRSEQRIEQLVNIGRPLTEDESEELYRALHADYTRKWRIAKARNERRRDDLLASEPELSRMRLLAKVRQESGR